MTAHSKLGASGAERWMNCPGSIAASEDMPESPSSRFAAEGTVAHAVGEWTLGNYKRQTTDLLGWWGDDDGRLFETEHEAVVANKADKITGAKDRSDLIFEVTEEMIEAVNVYVDFIRGTIADYEMLGSEPALLVEQGFNLGWVREGMFGTNDACIFVPGEILIVADYKHGRGKVVEVEDNPQLMYYALGALRTLCWDDKKKDWNGDLLPKTISLVVVQPRARHANGPVREWSVDPTYLMEDFLAELLDAANATALPNAKLRAGDWCTFCPAKPVCTELQDSVVRSKEGIFDDIFVDDLVDEETAKKIGKRKALEFSTNHAERLSEILKAAPMMEEFIRSVAAYAMGEAERGVTIPGYKLVRKRSHRKWKDESKVIKDLTCVLEDDQLFTKKLKSPAQLEKDKALKEAIKDYVETPPGQLTLTEESDNREAVVVNPFSGMGPEDDESIL
jgi:hypothetical protein